LRLGALTPTSSRGGGQVECFWSTAPWIRSHIKHNMIALAGEVSWRNAPAMKKVYPAVTIVLDATAPFFFIEYLDCSYCHFDSPWIDVGIP
jgi:hypothetical protein